MIDVLVLDVNETLTDMEPLRDGFEAVGLPRHSLEAWFAATLRDGLALTAAGAYANFGELAAELGQPNAARAVGNACGSNRLALIVPCHRVVREDGSPGGWRWGVERKLILRAREAAALQAAATA